MKSRIGESIKQQIQMIRTNAAAFGCVSKVNIRVGVMLFNKYPKALQSSRVEELLSNFL